MVLGRLSTTSKLHPSGGPHDRWGPRSVSKIHRMTEGAEPQRSVSELSLYEMVFPDPTRRRKIAALCALIGTDELDGFPRLRDAWVELIDDEIVLAFYARIGGGNRREYASAIIALQAHPHYLSDRDDRSDPTYATFRFALPAARADLMPGLSERLRSEAHPGEVDTDQRWADAIAAMERGEISPATLARADQLFAGINEAFASSDGPLIIEI